MSNLVPFILFVESASGGHFVELGRELTPGGAQVRWTVLGGDGKGPLGPLPPLIAFANGRFGWEVGGGDRNFSTDDLWSVCPAGLNVDNVHPGLVRLAADIRGADPELDGRALAAVLCKRLGLHAVAASIVSMLADRRWRFDSLRNVALTAWRFDIEEGSLKVQPPYRTASVEAVLSALETVSAESVIAEWRSGAESREWMQPNPFLVDASGYWEFVDP